MYSLLLLIPGSGSGYTLYVIYVDLKHWFLGGRGYLKYPLVTETGANRVPDNELIKSKGKKKKTKRETSANRMETCQVDARENFVGATDAPRRHTFYLFLFFFYFHGPSVWSN